MPAIRNGTLTATVVESIDMGVDVGEVDVLNVDGADAIYVRVDGTDPAVGADDSYAIPAVAGAAITIPVRTDGNTEVRLISAGTPAYSVTADF